MQCGVCPTRAWALLCVRTTTDGVLRCMYDLSQSKGLRKLHSISIDTVYISIRQDSLTLRQIETGVKCDSLCGTLLGLRDQTGSLLFPQ